MHTHIQKKKGTTTKKNLKTISLLVTVLVFELVTFSPSAARKNKKKQHTNTNLYITENDLNDR